MPGRLILRPDIPGVEGIGLPLVVGSLNVAEAGTALFAEVELVVEIVLEVVLELVLELVAEVVLQLVLSLGGEIADVVGLGDEAEDVPVGVGKVLSKVVVIVISVSDTLGASKPGINVNFRCKGK
jgi:hypothetical protein